MPTDGHGGRTASHSRGPGSLLQRLLRRRIPAAENPKEKRTMAQSAQYARSERVPVPTPDLEAGKARQQAMWASGDYGVIGTTLQIVGESLAEAVDLEAGSRVLDVACGNGNASLAAARRFCKV